MSAPLVRRSPVHAARVVDNVEVTPRMRRVTVRAESLTGVAVTPAQDVELHLAEPSGRRVKRRYTIRFSRPDTGELDLDVLLHGDGPGSRWGSSAAPGDELRLQGPRGKLELRPAAHHLLVGDESALPAIATICAALPAGKAATALIEIGDDRDEQPVEAAHLRWVHRGPADVGTPDLLRDTLAEVEIPPGSRAYLMGESRAMIALRPLIESRGVEHDDVFVKGYWNIGRPDRIAGRAPERIEEQPSS